MISKGIIDQKSKKRIIILLSVVLCIIGAFVVFKIIEGGKKANDIPRLEKSIAVLPFVNDSPDKENEYFCNGMMDEILTQLQKISDLRVKARTSVEKYRNPDRDIKDIGRELGVSLIIEGSVRKAGDDLRITAQLIDTKTGDHLWAETYDGKYTTKIFEFQSNVAKKVAVSLNAIITPKEEKRIDTKPTTDMLAYDLSLKGHEMFLKWNYTFDSLYLKLGLNLFNQALKIDPNNLDALGGKGIIYRESGKYDSALFYYERINDIDPVNLPGVEGIGTVYLYSNRFDSALKYLQISIEHSPNEPWAYASMGQLLILIRKDLIKGLPYYQKAYDLGGNADAEINRNLAWIFSSIREYQKALKFSNNAIKIRSDCGLLIENDYYLAAQGNYSEALHFLDSISSVIPCEQKCDIMRFHIYTELKEFEKAEKFYNKALNSGYKLTEDDNIYIGYLYKETGRKKEALLILNNSIKRDGNLLNSTVSPWTINFIKLRLASTYSILGENRKALEYLSKLQKSGVWEYPLTLRTFPGFDNLRRDPEFIAIVKRIEDEKASIRAQVKEMEKRGEIDL